MKRIKTSEKVARYILDNYDALMMTKEYRSIDKESWHPDSGELIFYVGDVVEVIESDFIKFVAKENSKAECGEEYKSFEELVNAVKKKLGEE